MQFTWDEENMLEKNGEGILSNTSRNIIIEKPYSTDAHPVNGNYAPEDEDEDDGDEDDLILGDDELVGDEEEFEVELEEDIDEDDVDEDDLVIDTDDEDDEDDL